MISGYYLKSSQPLTEHHQPQTGEPARKPRWSHTPMYIADDPRLRPEYNFNIPVNEELRRRLEKGGLDPLLATHFANILGLDPISITRDDIESFEKTNFFEAVHSAYWPHVDLKLPSPENSTAGWRVEFRPMEIQLTDFDNAAFAIFMVLLRLAIVHFDLNFYVPIERVAENMQIAHVRDAVQKQSFFWRKDVFPPSRSELGSTGGDAAAVGPVEEEYTLMTLNNIINGSSSNGNGSKTETDSKTDDMKNPQATFPGLLPILGSYMREVGIADEEKKHIDRYLAVIRGRADGGLWNPAGWMRQFVRAHDEYKHDSVVSERICYDLLKKIKVVGEGKSEDGEHVFVRRQELK